WPRSTIASWRRRSSRSSHSAAGGTSAGRGSRPRGQRLLERLGAAQPAGHLHRAKVLDGQSETLLDLIVTTSLVQGLGPFEAAPRAERSQIELVGQSQRAVEVAHGRLD